MQKDYKGCKLLELIKQTLKYKKELIYGNIYAILATITTVVTPLFIPMLIDELLIGKSAKLTKYVSEYIVPMSLIGYVVFFLFLIILLRFLSAFFAILQTKQLLIVAKGISYRLRVTVIEHLKKVQLKEYERFLPGAITSKLVTDINTIDEFIATVAGKIVVSSLILIFTSIILLFINWQLALFIILTNPLVIFLTAKLSKNIGKLKRHENKSVEDFQSTLSDTLELFNQIKAVNKEEYFFNIAKLKANNLREKSIEFNYKSISYAKISYFTFLSGYELFRSASILAVAYSDLSIGFMLAIFGYLWIMSTPTFDIINFQYSLASARSACKRVSEVFELDTERDLKDSIDPFTDDIDIKLENMNFAYEDNRYILNNISMEIKGSSKVALVGPSGSGKTTIGNILAGFYEPNSGELQYNGASYKSIKPATIRQNVYLILQHPKLFNDTMRFNLTLGRNISEDKIKNALKIAQLSDVVENLTDGLNTVVGRDGVKLSGGQRQRVAIARMVLEDPKVVIFDESTSALDIHTETKLFKELHIFLESKIVVTIAHRLSTIEKAEYIFVLENGKLVESGTPEDLMKKSSGYFASMV